MPATLAITNARIYTGRDEEPWAEALASEGERIVALGSEQEVRRIAGPRTEVLDAGGRLVLPGFIDPHVHLIWGYELGSWIDLTDKPSLREVQRRLAAHAEGNPREELVIGHGFDYVALRPGGLPGKEDLDAAVSDRPVLITSWDGHTGIGNTRFVSRARDVHGSLGHEVGQMQRDDSTGEPTGVFHEAFDITPHLPEFQRRRSLDGLRRTLRMASSFGITTAFDVQVSADDLHAYETLWMAGDLGVRIRAALYHPPDMARDGYAEFIATKERPWDDWLRVGAVKLYIDGVQETGTAAFLEPYANDPTSVGSTQYPPEVYEAIVEELDRDGFQVCTHACGDRGARIALDAYERASHTNGTSGLRHRVEHCENLSPVDIPRFGRLGVVPCMMPRHANPELLGRWREAVGPERTKTAFAWRELIEAGANLAFASDWPVADMNPLVGIQEVVTRTVEGGSSPRRLSVAEAIEGYARKAAYACFADATRGTLAKGMYADFVVLSQNLLEIPPHRIRETKVLRTVVGGRTVHAVTS